MSAAGSIAALAASVVIVLGGVGGLARFMWRIAQTVRDNTRAVTTLTRDLAKLSESIDARFDALEARGRRRRL